MDRTESAAKTYLVSLPPELADRAEALARRDHRTMDELFRDAMHTYSLQVSLDDFEAINRLAATRNPHGYSEEDLPRLIREVREEADAAA